MKRMLVVGATALAALAALAPPSGAVPAPPDSRTLVRQPNGKKLTLRVFGDEHYHGHETLRGYTVVRHPVSKYWVYARKAARGRLVPTRRGAGRVPPARLSKHLRDRVKLARAQHAPGWTRASSPSFPATGAQRQLVILAAYANTTQTTAASSWTSRFFGATNSLKHYYEQASYGKLSFAPAADSHGTYADGIVGWVKINAYNGPSGSSWAATANQIIAAIRAADPYVNFGAYDTAPRNGRISPNELHVTIIAAGDEQAICGGGGVWAHKYSLGSSSPTLDGVSVGYHGYTIFGEMQCVTSSTGAVLSRHQATIGIIAHELGHDLGMPDLYDTDKSSHAGLNGGVGSWSLMASGSWNRAPGGVSGSSPSQVDAFLKSYMGWLTPEQVVGPTSAVSLAQSETNARAVRLRANPGDVDWSFGARSGSGEYFLLENRQRVGYDVGLPGCGVLVWHVNEAVTSANTANADENGPRLLDLEEGDGGSSPRSSTDPWPSTKGEFNDQSVPNARLYSGALTGVKVTTVSPSCAATMTVNTSDGSAAPGNPNDNFAAATVAGTLPYAQTGIATATATKQVGEQAPTCDATIGRTVWWRFTPATSMRVKAETTGSNYDTVLAAWTGTTLGALTQAACNDDPPGQTQAPSSFELDLTAGQTYYFQAGGFGAASGSLNFSLSRVSTAPANDAFVSAAGVSEPLPFAPAVIATGDATTEAGEPQPSCGAAGKTVWFSYTPQANVTVKAETTGSNFDTVLAAYRGTAINALTQVACNDDPPGTPSSPSSLEVALTGGQTYFFQAGGFNNAGTIASGNLTFKVTRVATAPANDGFAGATLVSVLPFETAGPNADATVEAGEPTPSCAATGKTVWYRFVPAATMSVAAETTNSSLEFDTVLAVYRGTALNALTEVACNDDVPGHGGAPSKVHVTLTGGQTYYFQAGGFRDTAGKVAEGTLGFKLSVLASSDSFAGAIAIGGAPFSQTGTTSSATEEGGEPLTSCAPIGKTVWYRFTPSTNMTVTVSTQGSAFDTVLVAWRGTAFGALTQVGCDDDGIATGGASRITGLALTAGQTYYFQVGGYRYANTTESGAYSLSLQ